MKNAYKLIKSRRIYQAVLVVCFCFFTIYTMTVYFGKNMVMFSSEYAYLPMTNYDYKFGSNIILYIIPLICGIFITDLSYYQKQMASYIFTRVSRRKYEYKYLAASFIVGFLLVFFILFCVIAIAFSAIQLGNTFFGDPYYMINFEAPLYDGFPLDTIFINNPWYYQGIFVFLNSLYGGLIAAVSYSISLLIKKKYQVTLTIFMVSLLWIPLINTINGPQVVWYPQLLFLGNPVLVNYPGESPHLLGILIWISLLFIISILLTELHLRNEEF